MKSFKELSKHTFLNMGNYDRTWYLRNLGIEVDVPVMGHYNSNNSSVVFEDVANPFTGEPFEVRSGGILET